jgi:hypothetical protein
VEIPNRAAAAAAARHQHTAVRAFHFELFNGLAGDASLHVGRFPHFECYSLVVACTLAADRRKKLAAFSCEAS